MTRLAVFVAALFIAPRVADSLLLVLLPPPSGDLSSFLARFAPAVWTPTILALVFVATASGGAGVREELTARLRYQRGSARWFALAAVLPILAVAAAVTAARLTGHGAPFTPSAAVLPMIGVQIITGAVGEELGWRGYLLPRLRAQVGATASFWVMGILWSLWHLPAFFTPGLPHQFWPIQLVLPFLAFFGVFLGYVFNRAGESVLTTMTAHLSLNIMLGFGGAAMTSSMFWGILGGLFGLTAALITVGSAPRPSGRPTSSRHTERGALL